MILEIIEVFQILADYLKNKNLFNFAEKLLSVILNFNKANLLPNHPHIGVSMNNLAEVLQCLNRLK
jgi:hypothetical protein